MPRIRTKCTPSIAKPSFNFGVGTFKEQLKRNKQKQRYSTTIIYDSDSQNFVPKKIVEKRKPVVPTFKFVKNTWNGKFKFTGKFKSDDSIIKLLPQTDGTIIISFSGNDLDFKCNTISTPPSPIIVE